jgi:branched-chain amino acid aminotransferase
MIERRISIQEVLEGIQNGAIREVFGSGTAAVISPVGALSYQAQTHTIGDGQTGPVAQRFFDNLTGIQYGRLSDPFGWSESIE